MNIIAEVVSLHCYPVKSCRAIDLREAVVLGNGLPHDREWMMVDGRGQFVTQRTHPGLARVEPFLDAQSLRLRCAGHPDLLLPLAATGPERSVRIWDDETGALDAGDTAAAWCSAVLGAPLRLVRASPASPRHARERYAGSVSAPIRFPDGFPLLLLSAESLDALNERLGSPLPMNRFRPNIVIRGAGIHAEDALRELSAGDLVLQPVKPCTRCRITKTDQLTGEVTQDDEPLRTLKTYRWDRELHGITFGQNCVVAGGAGATLRVGDRFVCR